MNFNKFVEALDADEIDELYTLLWKRKKDLARATVLPINDFERALLADNKLIEAIREYKNRNNTGLFEAKVAIDTW